MTRADLPATVDCGHAPQPSFYTAGSTVTVGHKRLTMTGDEVMFPGWATLPGGRKVCPDCADSMQAAELSSLAFGDRFGAYLSADGRNVTTWTGGVLARVTRVTRNARQTFIRARGADGTPYAGVGPAESGTYVTLRRVKS